MTKKSTKLKSRKNSALPDCSNLERILAEIPDGRKLAVSYMRQLALTTPRYEPLVADFDSNPQLDLGLLCDRHKLPPADFLADINRVMYEITDEAMKFAKGVAQTIIAKRLPKVVERGLIEGAKADGIADRHFTLQKEGFHTAPKGTQINLNQQNLQLGGGASSFEDHTRELNEILGDAVPEDHLLDAANEKDFIEAEVAADMKEEQVA